ncbi:ras GTPase-activating-like protein IQGAP1 [Macrobrachium nipponense]|uniref:ras GTPase-activating-like protein IQGAP1 n=1 Tax=Macrobrachium nipponense TaxID=159736 RepID=UPI0030C8405A
MEVCLALTNKFEVAEAPEEKETKDSNKMFNRHSLHEVKTRLSHNLRRLENQALVSRADNYQALLTAIAGDIVNQRQHKVARRMVVGNLLYYRYINSAIVAPDAFDIIKVSPDQKLNNAQRRNLASIAKILQFAASKKGFADEASHLTCLNPFIIECHEKFKAFFRQCCEVEDPEVVYNVNHYSEATLIVKPTIYISVQEICETHQLLLDHEEILAPDSSDHLHVLLSDLGERPSVNSLVGVVDSVTGSGSVTLGRMEVCLALTNKFEVAEAPEEKETKDSNKMFNRTKQLLVDVMQCVDGCTVGELAKLGYTISP